ncbi:MAG TPA: DUF948 domain-containing protein [Gaiellaceae bacterium]|nr:DUF948 domain-containing protein [Gaiellaceae bacterium]
MPLADFETLDVLWIVLSAFLVVVGLALAFVLVRLGATVRRVSSLIQGLEKEVLPLINKAGGTVDRVNLQLDKLDRVTDSAVDAADSLDTAVRAVTIAVTRPVQKLSGLAAGLSHGIAALRSRRDFRGALQTGRAAAARREHEIEIELEHGGEDA